MKQKKWIKIISNKLNKPLTKKEIAKLCKTKSNSRAFEEFLAMMLLTGKLIKLKNGKYGLSEKMSLLTGIIDVNPKGFGFIIPDNGGEDIYVAMHNMNTALDKDRVVFKIIKESITKKREARIIRVIERASKKLTGVFIEGNNYDYVICDNKKIHKNIIVIDSKVKVKTGQNVIVELKEWKSNANNPEGIIIDTIEKTDTLNTLNKRILIDNGFDEYFDKNVMDYAKSIDFSIDNELRYRKDLREEFIITIDPKDAKDFDDAISVKQVKDNYTIKVHIADVSYFVKENSILDKEAYKRATSVYLTGKTIPMLPEYLSNDICSLKEGVDRLTLTCEFTVNKYGKPIDYKIYPSIINSKKRLNYEQAQIMIDNADNSELSNTLKLMNKIAKKLRKYYNTNGRIDFDRKENEIVLDENNIPVNVLLKKQYDTHKMIEDFMITANMFVALHLSKLNMPVIYRIHDKPGEEKIKNLNFILQRYNYSLKNFNPKRIQKILKDVKNKSYAYLIQETILRTMQRAIYSVNNIGHFGLGLKYYTHFTSPIRRYPDLIIHRMLRKSFTNKKINNLNYELIAKHCSEREWSAEKSERDSSMFAKLMYLKNINKRFFNGIVSSLTSFGIFILIEDVFVEGLIRFRDMDDDYYQFYEKEFLIIGNRNKKQIKLGDRFLVEVKSIIPEKGQLDLSIKKKL